jgi:hypothetical protein
MDYFEARISQLGEQLAASIAANVSRILVNRAPQRGVLRHCDDQAAAWAQRRMHLEERSLVLLDVFEHVERTDDVELRLEGQLPRVQLAQLGVRDSLRSDF